jgi:hypothetical protein
MPPISKKYILDTSPPSPSPTTHIVIQQRHPITTRSLTPDSCARQQQSVLHLSCLISESSFLTDCLTPLSETIAKSLHLGFIPGSNTTTTTTYAAAAMPAPIDIRMAARDSFVADSNSFSMSYTWSNSFRGDNAFME